MSVSLSPSVTSADLNGNRSDVSFGSRANVFSPVFNLNKFDFIVVFLSLIVIDESWLI